MLNVLTMGKFYADREVMALQDYSVPSFLDDVQERQKQKQSWQSPQTWRSNSME